MFLFILINHFCAPTPASEPRASLCWSFRGQHCCPLSSSGVQWTGADSSVSKETWQIAGSDHAQALAMNCDSYGGSWVSTILMARPWPAGFLPNSAGLPKPAQLHLRDRHGSAGNQDRRKHLRERLLRVPSRFSLVSRVLRVWECSAFCMWGESRASSRSWSRRWETGSCSIKSWSVWLVWLIASSTCSQEQCKAGSHRLSEPRPPTVSPDNPSTVWPVFDLANGGLQLPAAPQCPLPGILSDIPSVKPSLLSWQYASLTQEVTSGQRLSGKTKR